MLCGLLTRGTPTAIVVPTDPFFSSVVLLMGFEGANGSTGAPGMTDESAAAHGTATVFDNAQISTAQAKFGGSALLSDGNGDFIQFPTSNDWQLSASNTDQYTIECWAQPTVATASLTQKYIFWQNLGAPNFCWFFGFETGSQLTFAASPDGTSNSTDNPVSSGLTWTIGQWYVLAVDKDATGKIRIYRDGVMVASGTPVNSAIFNGVAGNVPLNVGGTPVLGSFSFPGYLEEVRLTKGVARYASDGGYTVPTARFPRS